MTFWKYYTNPIALFSGLLLLLTACNQTSLVDQSPTLGEDSLEEEIPATSSELPEEPTDVPGTSGERQNLPTEVPEPTEEGASNSIGPPTPFPASKYADLQIVTLLPPDAIPAIDNPQFLSASEADAYYDPDELVMGVTFNRDTRAYSVPFLSNHEIVNDTVGGVKIAVTW